MPCRPLLLSAGTRPPTTRPICLSFEGGCASVQPMVRPVVTGVAIALAACSSTPTAVLPDARIALNACRVPGYEGEAVCGVHEVWENREARSGRRIPIHVVVLPSREPRSAQRSVRLDPVFYFDGGPGSSAIGAAGWVARLLSSVHDTRDLVFVDIRGTGRSAPLRCPEGADDESLQRYFDEFLSDAYVRRCLDAQEADVRFYNQAIAIDDVDEVRAALGYERINLYGTSSGTRQAQLYMRQHGKAVRAAVLHGVAPVDAEVPLAFARAMEDGIRMLIDGCARDGACAAAHPALDRAWERAKERFGKGPVRATVRHPRTGRPEQVIISSGVFADGVRHMLYNLQAARVLVERIEAAARGDFAPFAQAKLQKEIGFSRAIAHGFLLSSTCAEDVRFIDDNDVRRATAGTFLGDYRVRRQQAACAIWPKGEGIGEAFQQPVKSDVPVLVISGDADVATPASHAERVVRHLPNARHVVFPDQGHALRDPVCAGRLITAFIATADAKRLDTSCAEMPSP